MARIHAVNLSTDASGAALGGSQGHVVVVVDIIDMSTTLEAALDAGAVAVFGASPDGAAPPVQVDPEAVGRLAGNLAVREKTDVVVVAEPRVGDDELRAGRNTRVVKGIKDAGAGVGLIVPNLGAETVRLVDFGGRVVVAATGTGGVAYDAALAAGAAAVTTATVARTMVKKGFAPARAGAARALELARATGAGITVVAASGNSLEDVLAAEYIARLILEDSLSRR
jgi:phosphosulfolactate phosphohydrolase-like enzyme